MGLPFSALGVPLTAHGAALECPWGALECPWAAYGAALEKNEPFWTKSEPWRGSLGLRRGPKWTILDEK